MSINTNYKKKGDFVTKYLPMRFCTYCTSKFVYYTKRSISASKIYKGIQKAREVTTPCFSVAVVVPKQQVSEQFLRWTLLSYSSQAFHVVERTILIQLVGKRTYRWGRGSCRWSNTSHWTRRRGEWKFVIFWVEEKFLIQIPNCLVHWFIRRVLKYCYLWLPLFKPSCPHHRYLVSIASERFLEVTQKS